MNGPTADAPGAAATLDPSALALALLRLRAEGDHAAADALLASTPGAAPGTEAKAMREGCGSAGGFLVPPQSKMRKRRRRVKSFVNRVLKSLGGE